MGILLWPFRALILFWNGMVDVKVRRLHRYYAPRELLEGDRAWEGDA